MEAFKGWKPPHKFTGLPENGSREYTFRRKLGEGSCAVVYEYVDSTNGKSVAVKFPAEDIADDEYRAFRLSQQINPERTYDCHLSPAYESLRMKHTPGGMAQIWGWGGEVTFGDAVGSREFWGRFSKPMPVLLSLLKQTLTGISRLHETKHIHCDLHMDNIMLHEMRDGYLTPNIIDFGLCMPMEWKPGSKSMFGKTSRFGRVRDVPRGEGPCKGYCQHPPELWVPYIRLARKPGRTEWPQLNVHGSHDVWSVGVIFYAFGCALNMIERGKSSGKSSVTTIDKLIEKMACQMIEADGDCDHARITLRRATSALRLPELQPFLDAMLDPDPSCRISAADILGA